MNQKCAHVASRQTVVIKLGTSVLTGGTSKMEGVVELAESIFQTSVRLGVPSKFQGMENILQNPIYATSIGLVSHGHIQKKDNYILENNQSLISKFLNWAKGEY